MCTHLAIRGQLLVTVRSFLPPRGAWGSNPAHTAQSKHLYPLMHFTSPIVFVKASFLNFEASLGQKLNPQKGTGKEKGNLKLSTAF